MTPRVSLREVESEFRSAIGAESFTRAQQLLAMYADALEREIRALDPRSPAILDVQAAARDLFEWAKSRIKAFRACAEAESARLRSVHSYDQQVAPARPVATA